MYTTTVVFKINILFRKKKRITNKLMKSIKHNNIKYIQHKIQ